MSDKKTFASKDEYYLSKFRELREQNKDLEEELVIHRLAVDHAKNLEHQNKELRESLKDTLSLVRSCSLDLTYTDNYKKAHKLLKK